MRRLASPRGRAVRGQPRVSYYPLRGGEDLIVPALSADPGSLSYSLNYECDQDGRYHRIDGYEVFDGQPKPSEASYWIISFSTGNAALAQGTAVNGQTSSATGTVLSQVLESGTYAGGDAVGYFVLTNVSGTFQSGENIRVVVTTKAVSTSAANQRGASTAALDTTYYRAAIEYARSLIAAVPGSGEILGTWQYKGVKYAWRNNAGDTAAAMYKSSTAGWVLCDLGRIVAFTSGSEAPSINAVLVGATSTKTAVVKRVLLRSGTWAGGDAAGYFILYSQSGALQAENLDIQGGTANVAAIAGNSTENTLAKDGFFRAVNHNFYGSTDYYRMYVAYGEGYAFEWDGSTYVPIMTGMTVDKPTHVFPFANHLFLVFPGGSLQVSPTGDPTAEWTAVTGAAELGIGEEITCILEMPGPAFIIWGRNRIKILTGTSIDDFALADYSLETGAIENTVQKIGPGIFMDDRGLVTLSTTQAHGNYSDAVISKKIQPYLSTKKTNIVASVAVKDKTQYRLFFDDMTAITMTLSNGKLVGFTRQVYDVQMTCCVSTENSTGFEEIFFGGDDGFVYQMDKGTSFNGNAMAFMLRTHFNHLGTPQNNKIIRKALLELSAPAETELFINCEFDYSESDSGGAQAVTIPAMGAMLGGVATLGSFVLGGRTVSSAAADIDADGANFCIIITGESTYVEAHTIQGAIVLYDIRGIQR